MYDLGDCDLVCFVLFGEGGMNDGIVLLFVFVGFVLCGVLGVMYGILLLFGMFVLVVLWGIVGVVVIGGGFGWVMMKMIGWLCMWYV